ncbi:DMT family transporter [Cytophaga hutchinsonii]|jgi:drug/metabolite transporter (DMT)-like permease|uniref:Permease, DMT family n=1 Tax=Cytophaga hutchinsonii (strain ATCC 33406 / DSM 1761 / CIP 103989 / NBRC 15051 / NCIMB 9469 / D465) TaxID=269798 RepID=A0A6N4STM8_CYTH3|nr:DMT family transporter [Cytophaga hutchinsonii]ABG59662.1 permease, DMT family [Cytophaga hutchinsonii ATCC 33406]SFX66376.1 Permease of the drug/metabolite transporter (DMT) superfamily [Cytophaga hutchinsonii ATCC 33406]
MNRIARAHIFLSILTIISGFNYTIAKIAMPVPIQPSSIIWIRMCCTTIFFFFFILLAKRSFFIAAEDRLRLFLCAIFGITINQIFFFEGLSRTMPINTSLIMAGIPITVFILSAIFLKEKMNWMNTLGLTLSAAGAALLLLDSKGKLNGLFIGDLFILINAISYGIFLILARQLMQKYDSVTVIFWIFLIGACLTFPYSYANYTHTDWAHLPVLVWLAVGFIVVFATIVNYYIGVDVLKDVSPAVSSMYVYIQPIFTTAIAMYFGSDKMDAQKLFYALAILLGVYLVSKSTGKKTLVDDKKGPA